MASATSQYEKPTSMDHSIPDAPFGIVLIDASRDEAHLISSESFLGYSRDDLHHLSLIRAMIHEDDRFAFDECLTDNIDPKKPVGKIRLKSKSGNWVQVMFRSLPVDTQPQASDIDEEKRTADSKKRILIIVPVQGIDLSRDLIESEARFRAVVSQAPVGIAIADQDGHLIEWNSTIEKITGYPAEEAFQIPIWSLDALLLDSSVRTTTLPETRIKSAFESGQAEWFGNYTTVCIRRKDGQRRWVTSVFFPIKGESSIQIGMICQDVTEQQQTEQHVRLQVQHSEAIARMASRINTELDIDRLLAAACSEITLALNVPFAVAQLYDEQSDTFAVRRVSGPAPISQQASLYQPIRRTAYEALVERMGPVIHFEDARMVPGLVDPQVETAIDIRTVIIVGMIHDNKTLGLLTIVTLLETRTFAQEEITLLQIFADQIAEAIAHAQLFEVMRGQAKTLEILNQITTMALESSSLQEMVSALAQRLVSVMATDGCFISLWDEDRHLPYPVAAFGSGSADFMKRIYQPDEQSLTRSVLETGSAMFVQDLLVISAHTSAHTGTLAGKFAALVLPLRVGEQRLGALTLIYKNPHLGMSKQEIGIWEKMALQVSLAVQKMILLEQERQRRNEAEALQQATAALVSSLNLTQVLDTILAQLAAVITVDIASVMLIEEDHLRIVAAYGREFGVEDRLFRSIPDNTGFFVLLRETEIPVIINNVQTHPLSKSVKKIYTNLQTWMGVPLTAFGGRIGYLTIGRNKDQAFLENDARFASTFAQQAAVVIENARLFEEVRNGNERLRDLSRKLVEVQEAERRMLAYELHDQIGQELTALTYGLEMGKHLKGKALDQVLNETQGLAQNLMGRVRELSLSLQPSMLDDLGLQPSLEWLIRRYQAQTDIRVEATFENLDRRFDSNIEMAAFRVVQEALTNVARHAQVKQAYIFARIEHGFLCVEVRDHGKGFDSYSNNYLKKSLGLAGMSERTHLVGGKFEIDSKPGQGTRVYAAFPIDIA